MTKRTFFQRWRLRDAWRALGKLWADPDNTTAVFEIIDALPGRAVEKAFYRFRDTPVGKQVLAERRQLLGVLNDRAYLASLDAGSFGRTYLDFITEQHISADGLVAASEEGSTHTQEDEDVALFGARLRDMHDLWHIVSGYHRDLRGEIALLAFSFAQVRTPGVGFIVFMAYKDAEPAVKKLIRGGWRRGRAADWLPAADWEALLQRPLAEVRDTLRLDDPPQYEREFSEGAPIAQGA